MPYTGLVTRAIALVIDALIIHAVALVTGAVVGLVVTAAARPRHGRHDHQGGRRRHLPRVGRELLRVLLEHDGSDHAARTSCASGSCPTNKREPLSVPRAVFRFVGLILATIPLFAGFWPVLFTRRRRGLPDWMANTVVVDTDDALL